MACTLVSAAISALLNAGGTESAAPSIPSKVTRKKPITKEATEPHDSFEQIDHLILAANYRKAAQLCEKRFESASPGDRQRARYRLGLCQEATGDFQRAANTYSDLAAHADSRLCLLARFGQVRCLIGLGDFPNALTLAATLQLQVDDPSIFGMSLYGELLHCVGLIRYLQATEKMPEAPAFSTACILQAKAKTPIAHFLEWEQLAVELLGNETPPLEDGPMLVYRDESDIRKSSVTLQRRAITAAQLLAELADACDLSLEIGPEEKRRLSGISIRSAFAGLTLSEVLSSLSMQCGLVWNIHGQRLEITGRPAEAPTVQSRERSECCEAMECALDAAPEHPFAPFASAAIACLLFQQGRYAEAARQFELVLAQSPDEQLSRITEYNLGLTCMSLGARSKAREYLLNVVDRNNKDELAGMAWWQIARSHLDADEAGKAISALKHAATNASLRVQAAACLGLAEAHLLLGMPGTADSMLQRPARSILRDDEFRTDAAFLGALTRFRMIQRKQQSSDESEDLLWSLLVPSSNSILGPAGTLLRAQAFVELGMESEMARFLEDSLSEQRGPVATRMIVMLVQHYQRVGKWKVAGDWLLSLEIAADETTREWAGLQVADLSLKSGQPAQCLEKCRVLLRESKLKQEDILRVMGRAYEQMGDYRRAADCFSGKIPKP